MILRNLIQTSEQSPTQWEAINEYGEGVYIRYYFDTLTVYCPLERDDKSWEAFVRALYFQLDNVSGDIWRSTMSTDEMLGITGYLWAEEAYV